MSQSADHWIDCLRAFLHDPPDKALGIKNHEARALRYLAAALDVPPEEVRDDGQKAADWLASAIERLPLPKGTLRDCDGNELDPLLGQPFNRLPREALRRSSPIDGSDLTNATTIFRQAQDLSDATVDRRAAVIRALAQANGDSRLRAYGLWRLLPEALPHVSALPGDTRLMDHSIVDHCDAAMACRAALGSGRAVSLIGFSLGPVQDFIVKGRSLRDLWTGSYLLSWLTFHAMLPIIEELGPWCLTSPGLRGNALFDWWLGRAGVRDADGNPLVADAEALRCASLPNTFTALVPADRAADLARRVEAACRSEWFAISQAVQEKLHQAWGTGWDEGWKDQCAAVWDVRTSVLPFVTVTDSASIAAAAGTLRTTYSTLLGDLPQPVVDASGIAAALQQKGWAPGYVTEEGQGLWSLANDLLQRLLAANKLARAVPPHAPANDTREKCALFPGFAVMGPGDSTKANKEWWQRTVANHAPKLPGNLRGSERLSAPGLVKRFAFGAYFRAVLGRDDFPDTRGIAFAAWVADFRRTPGGEQAWIHWQKTVAGINHRAQDELEQPWAEHELLDEGTMVAGHWLHTAADEATLRRELETARGQRAKLIATAKQAGLPEPRPYYAVLVADGDAMGKILRGEKGPRFDQTYHPDMLKALVGLGIPQELLGRVRPQGLAVQLGFSRSLGDFTTHAGKVIAAHQGTCVYAGGDDVLAVLPVVTALSAAADLARTFTTWVPGATLSAGLAIVHCHEDLRVAIETARRAERAAKRSGRNALACTIARRSGDTTTAIAGWDLVRDWNQAAGLLAERSDRWVHHLQAERESLRDLPFAVVWARAQHHLLHGEEGGRQAKGLGVLFDQIRTAWESWSGDKKRELTPEDRVDQFLTWCQHAAWLAKFQRQEPSASGASA